MRIPVVETKENLDAPEKLHMYTVWAIPPDHVVRRIKKVMEGLRAEFGGPQIEPHITVVGSVLLTHKEAVKRFIEGCQNIALFNCKVEDVVTRKFFYQCVSLLIGAGNYDEGSYNVGHFICYLYRSSPHVPHLSLLYGNLTQDERERAREKVTILDEGLASLSFQLNRFVLYKTNYEDRDQQSWEKVLEYELQPRETLPDADDVFPDHYY